jgi:hypothetical protein
VAAAGFVKSQQWASEDGFQPKLLTKHLMQAEHVEQLQQLWQQHQSDFNAVHFSALMHQLSVLHRAAAVAAAVQQPVQKQQQQGQQSKLARPQQQQADKAAAARREAVATVAVVAAASAAVSSDKQYTELEDGLIHIVEELSTTSSSSTSADINSVLDLDQPLQTAQQQQQLVRPQQPNTQQWEQHKVQRQQQTVQQLAHAVAAYALSPGVCKHLDGRAVVMISHALAKVGLQDQQLLSRIVQATGPEGDLLRSLDAQQLCNLIWSVAVCVDAVNGVTATYMRQDLTPNRSSISSSSSRKGSSLHQYELPRTWLGEVSRAFQFKMPSYSSAGLTMAVWGFCRLKSAAPGRWVKTFFEQSGGKLLQFSRQELAVVAYALGKLKAEVSCRRLRATAASSAGQQQMTTVVAASSLKLKALPVPLPCTSLPHAQPERWLLRLYIAAAQIPAHWLSQYLAASTEGLTALSTQELSMSLWGLATCGAEPHKAWLMVWFLSSRASMDRASTQVRVCTLPCCR